MKKITFLLSLLFSIFFSKAQLLSWTPNFPVENDPLTNVVITADAAKGNQGLLNYTPVTDVYVHIGVITNLSANSSDWKYVKFTWGTTDPQAQCTSLGNNKWQYTITGGLRTYFGITNSAEHILKIAILFRSGDGSKKLANADGSDMYISVFDNSILSVQFTNPLIQPLYNPLPETISKIVGDNMNITALANKASTMTLYLNSTVVQTAGNATTISANPALTSSGNDTIVVEANDGTTTKKDTIQFFVTGGIVIAPLPGGVRDGINYESDNTAVTLVLYAPSKNRVSIIGEFPGSNWTDQTQYQMKRTPDGNYWWLRITGLTAGAEYAFQYLVDGTLKVADAYTEKILDPDYDSQIPSSTYPSLKAYPTGSTTGIVSIVQTAAPQYNWQVNNFTRPDKRKLVIYELLMRDFIANHNWNTLRDTLNYLQSLGINTIEIMPFSEFESNNSWGYNPDFYFAPDKYYGPKNTLKEFVDSCHKRGMAVVMDIVLNHATGQCPLAALYWNSATNQPAANNPWFNVTATHPYNVFNDFNHESLATRYFVSRVLEHWLVNYKLDGFRFDLSKGFTQKNSCTSTACNTDAEVAAWSAYDASRIAIWKKYYDTLQLKSPGCYAILEHFADNTEETELSNYGLMLWGNMAYNYQQAAMGYNTGWDFTGGIYTSRGWAQPNLVTYMESHDEERMMYKNLQYGNSSGSYNVKDLNTALKRIEMCGAFLFTIPGPKMFWEFGELGYDYSVNTCTNGTVNDSCRLTPKPLHWDYLQNIQRTRLHNVFGALIKLRFNNLYKDVFVTNQVTSNLSNGFKSLQVNTDSSKICVVGNFDVVSQTGSVTFQEGGTWYDYLDGTTINATGAAQNITLQPGEYHVYLNRNVASNIATPVTSINAPTNGLVIRVYPNPVGQTATIALNIPETGNVQVNMMNIMGQRLQTIQSGFLVKGNYFIELNNDKKLPSGVYLIDVKTKTSSGIAKIVLQ
ncbi:MAG TPA: alpha-amylase family glycosyl hydrolase [Chitinophagaceae bacterium]